MPRPTWPPKYVSIPITALLADEIPHAAFRFYCKLRALAWKDRTTLSIKLTDLMTETGLSQSRLYEYARLLRDRNELLFHCAQGVFECSLPLVDGPIPEKQESDFPGKRELKQPIPGKREFPSEAAADKKAEKTKGAAAQFPENRKTPYSYSVPSKKRETESTEGVGANSRKTGITGPSTTAEIQAEYEKLLGYSVKDWAAGESKSAKQIAECYTVAQFREVYRALKSQLFWKAKRLYLRHVVGEIDEYFAAKAQGRLGKGKAEPKNNGPWRMGGGES